MSTPTPKKRLKRPRKTPAHLVENAADDLDKKGSERTPRSLDSATAPVPRKPPASQAVWRSQARTDFVMDPDKRSVLWHYQRADRPYSTMWAERTFREFATDDHWLEHREKFWRDVEARVWDLQREKVVAQKLAQLGKLTHVYEHAIEYLAPIVDADTGEVKRYAPDHPTLANLPMLPLEMPSYDKYVGAMVKLGQQLVLLRGEATSRTESVPTDGQHVTKDPVGASQTLSQDELRAIARLLVRRRQPELADQPEIDIAGDGRPDVRSDEDDR